MIYDTANRLAQELRESEEYRSFAAARDKAMENDATKSLVRQYHQLQLKAQAAMVAGTQDGESMAQLQKLGELLQFNPDAAEYLMAEYKLNRMVGEVYKLLAKAVDTDLGMLEG